MLVRFSPWFHVQSPIELTYETPSTRSKSYSCGLYNVKGKIARLLCVF